MPEEMKFDHEVQALLHVDPFQPFDLIMMSGDRFAVTDPGFAVFGDSAVYLVQQRRGLAILRKSDVVDVETHQNPSAMRRRRRKTWQRYFVRSAHRGPRFPYPYQPK